jgi:hypothetical protein
MILELDTRNSNSLLAYSVWRSQSKGGGYCISALYAMANSGH